MTNNLFEEQHVIEERLADRYRGLPYYERYKRIAIAAQGVSRNCYNIAQHFRVDTPMRQYEMQSAAIWSAIARKNLFALLIYERDMRTYNGMILESIMADHESIIRDIDDIVGIQRKDRG